MDKRLENMRLFFPAEVTGAYVAIQGLLTSNGIEKTEYMGYMIFIAVALAAVNAAIYWKFYNTVSPLWQIVLAAGFLIWVGNIDTPRFKDLWMAGLRIELIAPTLLIFYTLITSFFELPKRIENAPKI
jgi:hypothetical protein